MGAQQVTGLANGSMSTDAAAFGDPRGAAAERGRRRRLLSGLPEPRVRDSAPLPETGGTVTRTRSPAVVVLTDASPVALNAALGNDHPADRHIRCRSTRRIGMPATRKNGQEDLSRLHPGPSPGGPYTLTFNSSWDFGAGSVPTWSTGASEIDSAGFRYNAVISKWCFLGSGLGF